MKATVAGATCTPSRLAEAVTALRGVAGEMREMGGRAWIVVGLDVTRAQLEALAEKVGPLVLFEVDVPLGGRGEGLSASRFDLPSDEGEQDLTDAAEETLADWLDQGGEGGFDEEEAATDLAWALAEDDVMLSEPPPSEDAHGAEDGPAERWARALLVRLLDEGSIELVRGASIHAPELIEGLAEVLRAGGDEVAEAVIDVLIDADTLAEIFVGPDEIEPLLEATRG